MDLHGIYATILDHTNSQMLLLFCNCSFPSCCVRFSPSKSEILIMFDATLGIDERHFKRSNSGHAEVRESVIIRRVGGQCMAFSELVFFCEQR